MDASSGFSSMAFSACSLTYEQEQLDPTDHLHFRSHQVHASHTRTLFWIFSLVETKSLNAERQMATHLWVKADWYRGVCESDEEHHSSKKPYRQRPVIFLLHLVLPARIFLVGLPAMSPKCAATPTFPHLVRCFFRRPIEIGSGHAPQDMSFLGVCCPFFIFYLLA